MKMKLFDKLGSKALALLAIGFVFISTAAFAAQGNWRVNFTTDQDTQTQQPSAKMPAIPDRMMPAKSIHSADTTSAVVDTSAMTIVEILSNDPSFSNLNKALKTSGLIDTLSEQGPFTVFAPNDQAFAKISPNTLTDLLNPDNKEKLAAILSYHIVPGKITEDRIRNMKIRTLQGKPLDVKVEGDKQTVNHAKILSGENQASNGVIYVIDTVLMP